MSQRGNLVQTQVFSIDLPNGWRSGIIGEDVEAPDRDALFENAYDCSCRITIGKRSECVTPEILLAAAWKHPTRVLTDAMTTDITELYSRFGIGKSITGRIKNQRVCFRYFVFSTAENLCLSREFWIEDNWKFFASDFEQLGQSLHIH